MSERTKQEVRDTLAHFSQPGDPNHAPNPHEVIRNQEIISTCRKWLNTPVDEHAAWLQKRLVNANTYRSDGDDAVDVEMNAYEDITEWLMGLCEWTEQEQRSRP